MSPLVAAVKTEIKCYNNNPSTQISLIEVYLLKTRNPPVSGCERWRIKPSAPTDEATQHANSHNVLPGCGYFDEEFMEVSSIWRLSVYVYRTVNNIWTFDSITQTKLLKYDWAHWYYIFHLDMLFFLLNIFSDEFLTVGGLLLAFSLKTRRIYQSSRVAASTCSSTWCSSTWCSKNPLLAFR